MKENTKKEVNDVNYDEDIEILKLNNMKIE